MINNKVIAIVNQKGGVAKTVTALNLSYALSEMGKRVPLKDEWIKKMWYVEVPSWLSA